MKSLSSLLGWLLLVAVLAVPSFLFYNWWTKSKQQASAELAQSPAPANIFPAADRNSATAQVLLSTSAAAPQPAPFPSRPAANPAVQDAPGPEARPAPAAAVSTAAAVTAPVSTASVQGVAVSTQTKKASYFSPKGDRDPTLSPDDYRRIKEAEMARKEAEEAAAKKDRIVQKKDSCESRLKLQGIVGSAVIINGDMYYAGQTIYGAKILKVGPDYILGECKGKKFRKGM